MGDDSRNPRLAALRSVSEEAKAALGTQPPPQPMGFHMPEAQQDRSTPQRLVRLDPEERLLA